MERGKKRYNQIKYEIEQKTRYLQLLTEQTQTLQIEFSFEELEQQLVLKEAEFQELSSIMESENFKQQSLDHMYDIRKNIVLQVKKYCTQGNEQLRKIRQKIEKHTKYDEKRTYQLKKIYAKYPYLKLIKNYIKEKRAAEKKLNEPYKSEKEFFDDVNEALRKIKESQEYEAHLRPTTKSLGLKFNDLLNDELSEFEEKRAVVEIFEHERQMKIAEMKDIEERRRALQMEQNQEKEMLLNNIKKQKRKEEDVLKNLKTDFNKFKQRVNNINIINDLENHQGTIEQANIAMDTIKEILQEEINSFKQKIKESRDKIKVLKFQTEKQQEQDLYGLKIDELEKEFLQKFNVTQENEIHCNKLQKTINEVATIVSRILYQLSGQNKNKNVEVQQSQLLNQLSVAGLKLERMLTILYKKKKNFRIESINTDGSYKSTPFFIGLNPLKIIDDNKEEEQFLIEGDDKLTLKEDDPFEVFENNFMHNNRFDIKTQYNDFKIQQKLSKKDQQLD